MLHVKQTFINYFDYKQIVVTLRLLSKCTVALTPNCSACRHCRWKLNNMIIDLNEEGSQYSLVGGNLVISNPIKNKHEGNYSCMASNTFGTVVSRKGSVQFGCKWPRCEPSFNLQCWTVPGRTKTELPRSCTTCIVSALKLQGQLGQIMSGVESAICQVPDIMSVWQIYFNESPFLQS